MLRLDGQAGGVVVAEVVAMREPVEEVEPEVSSQGVFDDLAVA